MPDAPCSPPSSLSLRWAGGGKQKKSTLTRKRMLLLVQETAAPVQADLASSYHHPITVICCLKEIPDLLPLPGVGRGIAPIGPKNHRRFVCHGFLICWHCSPPIQPVPGICRFQPPAPGASVLGAIAIIDRPELHTFGQARIG